MTRIPDESYSGHTQRHLASLNREPSLGPVRHPPRMWSLPNEAMPHLTQLHCPHPGPTHLERPRSSSTLYPKPSPGVGDHSDFPILKPLTPYRGTCSVSQPHSKLPDVSTSASRGCKACLVNQIIAHTLNVEAFLSQGRVPHSSQ